MTDEEWRHTGGVVQETGDNSTTPLPGGYYRKCCRECVHLHYRSNAGSCPGEVVYGDE